MAASGVERNAPCSRTGLHEAPAVGERDATDLAPDYIKTPIIKDVTSQGNAMFKNPDDPSESINVEDFCLRLV